MTCGARSQVDQSRRVCEAVAGGELDVAIVGGDIPLELADSLTAVPYAEARRRSALDVLGLQLSIRRRTSCETGFGP